METEHEYGAAIASLMQFCVQRGLNFKLGYAEAAGEWELEIMDYDIHRTSGFIKKVSQLTDAVRYATDDYQKNFDLNYNSKEE